MFLPMTQNDYTKEHREATQALLKGFVSNIVEGVASSRALSEVKVSCQTNARVTSTAM